MNVELQWYSCEAHEVDSREVLNNFFPHKALIPQPSSFNVHIVPLTKFLIYDGQEMGDWWRGLTALLHETNRSLLLVGDCGWREALYAIRQLESVTDEKRKLPVYLYLSTDTVDTPRERPLVGTLARLNLEDEQDATLIELHRSLKAVGLYSTVISWSALPEKLTSGQMGIGVKQDHIAWPSYFQKEFELWKEPPTPTYRRQVPGKRLLVIANTYPSESSIYRNGFIHRRVLGYKRLGYEVVVFVLGDHFRQNKDYEYEGVQVFIGNRHHLAGHISDSAKYDAYLVHFVNEGMIEPLVHLKVKEPVIVWLHGFETEAWHRRWFNYLESSGDIREALRRKSSYYAHQNSFMSYLFGTKELDLTFVNVSEWFQNHIVEPDAGVPITNGQIIHNLVDREVFSFRGKKPSDRLRVLSLRPYASYKYANDITIEAILEAAKRPWFRDFSFTIAGMGPLFEPTTAKIKHLSNVRLVNRFFNHHEIKRLHDTHGVFLVPTRFDSQGVSAGEAMSSGLVTISTAVSAIPEFIEHEKSGLLGAPESPNDIVQFLERIYFDPEFYQQISIQGSASIGAQCDARNTILRELDLIENVVSL
ncbi:glycosyltransferase family 4 protein [Micrococcoides hystricis]|uniref:Glycosyltransferase family 4 protein n=1 Tax=Micrococcoides hystricis TaxID=1572761 RepID=A0ABV6PC23_9MICC